MILKTNHNPKRKIAEPDSRSTGSM